MAIRYVRSVGGSDSNNGSTWALAKATLTGVSAIDTAGDTIYVSQNHAESTAGNITFPWNGTITSPTKIICGNDAAQPPTASATSATVTTTGIGTINLVSTPGYVYWYGISFNAGTGTSTSNINAGPHSSSHVFESCNFNLLNTSATAQIISSGSRFVNCGFKFSASGQTINQQDGVTTIRGGSVLSGGTSPTNVFSNSTAVSPCEMLVEGFDFSNCSSSVNLYNDTGANIVRVTFRNCKLPSSWSGALVTTPSNMFPESFVEMINCSAGSQNYKYWKQSRYGSILDETTIVRSGGASDGTTHMSWKLASLTTTYPAFPLQTSEIVIWNTVVGSSITATVEIVTDNVTLSDSDCWVELEYLGSSSQPIATLVTDRTAEVIGTGSASQSSSSVTWTTTGLSTPVKQKLVATFTSQMVGFIVARVILVKPSTTVYVDPVVTLT